MNFALDRAGRFRLHSREGGWDLVVDDKRVHYCLTPAEAVAYVAETMIDEIDVSGVRDVCDALARVREAAADAAAVASAALVSATLAPVVAAVTRPKTDDASRSDMVRDASLALGRCTLSELHVRDDRRHIVALAKAVLAPCFDAWEMP